MTNHSINNCCQKQREEEAARAGGNRCDDRGGNRCDDRGGNGDADKHEVLQVVPENKNASQYQCLQAKIYTKPVRKTEKLYYLGKVEETEVLSGEESESLEDSQEFFLPACVYHTSWNLYLFVYFEKHTTSTYR